MSIISDIYNGQHRPVEHKPVLPQEIKEKNLDFWNKASEMLGGEYVDEHLYHLSESEHLEHVQIFREGFRLGVLLMWEAFGMDAPTPV